jgi:hypothetical protein
MCRIGRFKSFYRRLALASAALLFTFGATAASHAASCDGQKGAVIFEDSFADDSGGWDLGGDPNAKSRFGAGGLAFHLETKWTGWTILNSTFNASNGDYCAEAVVPKAVGTDNVTTTGLVFWAVDYDNFYMWAVDSSGASGLYKKANGKWATVASGLTAPQAPATPGSVVALRVQAAGNLIVVSANGTELKKIRAPMPPGDLRFGLFFDVTPQNPASGTDYNVKRLKVTDGK